MKSQQRTTYQAVCRRHQGWWAITVPELADLPTQTRRLDQAEAMTRDLIATWLQVDPDSFDVNVTPQLPADVTTAMEAAQATRRQAERLSGEAATMNRDIARMLVDLGMPLRDVGAILGVSFQRAGQLAGQR